MSMNSDAPRSVHFKDNDSSSSDEEQLCEDSLLDLEWSTGPSTEELDEHLYQKFQGSWKREQSSSMADRISKQNRVRLQYNDERVRDRFCANAQRLLNVALENPNSNSTSVKIARKALRYRKVLNRLDQIDRDDPKFDVSSFFGVEWHKNN